MEHKGWHSRGYLPHFDSQDSIQFVTYRLADSLPKEALARIRTAVQPESLRSWKRFTAREANRQLGRTGPFWQDDYWDRFIRNEAHFFATIEYVDQNPVKAGLAPDARS